MVQQQTLWQSILRRVFGLIAVDARPNSRPEFVNGAEPGPTCYDTVSPELPSSIRTVTKIHNQQVAEEFAYTMTTPAIGVSTPLSHGGGSSSAIDEDIDEEIASISEHISFDDSHLDSEVSGGVPINAQASAMKRQLFAFGDDDEEDMDGPLFNMDDAMLDGGRIAEHFRVAESESDEPPDEPDSLDAHLTNPGSKPKEDQSINKIATEHSVSLSANIPEDFQTDNVEIKQFHKLQKEVSPLNDDVILLNNEKISLASLKNAQLPPLKLPPLNLPPLKLGTKQTRSNLSPVVDENPSSATTTNQNTTNDISDIGHDDMDDFSLGYLADPNLPVRNSVSKSLVEPSVSRPHFPTRSLGSGFKFMNHSQTITRSDGEDGDSKDSSYEAEHSIEELVISNASILLENPLANISNIVETSEIIVVPRILNEEQIDRRDNSTMDMDVHPDSLDLVSDGISDLKQILCQKQTIQLVESVEQDEHDNTEEIKKMMKVDLSKEALEDITEATEPSNDVTLNNPISNNDLHYSEPINVDSNDTILPQNAEHFEEAIESAFELDDQKQTSLDSVISLNMLQAYEDRIKDLENIVATKDVCLSALNIQLNRRESLKDGTCESCSMVTSSTEYRTYQDEYYANRIDYNHELMERENLIEQLTESLQQSMQMREQLQSQSEQLTVEVSQLRKQLAESVDMIRRPLWMRGDHESVGGGQRISEISIDLVSESDVEELQQQQQFVADGEDRSRKASYERQLDSDGDVEPRRSGLKQMDQFQKFLSEEELRIFHMVENKFEDYLRSELERMRVQADSDLKNVSNSQAAEKQDKDSEINRLRHLLANTKGGTPDLNELRRELEAIHGREMEDLRTYFERKCADLEKQYSEEIFSQHSRRHSNDSGSELSDQDNLLPDDKVQSTSQHGTPKRKNTKSDIWSSPTHRKITPTGIGELQGETLSNLRDEEDPEPTVAELNAFYRDKIADIYKNHEDTVRMLKFRLRRFETRSVDDAYMSSFGNAGSGEATASNVAEEHADVSIDQCLQSNAAPVDNLTADIDDEDESTCLKDIVAVAPSPNESHVIAQIIDEYDMRLREQVNMAKEDIVQALEEQIQALLSETATDDSQWPPELILLREKFTAKSQLEIAQIQIAHKEEMDRVKSELDMQHRKLRRHTTFDENRDLDQIVQERDNLRELSHTLRCLLSELAKCVSVCEDDINQTLVEELHKHGIETKLATKQQHNKDPPGDEQSDHSLDLNESGASTPTLDTSVHHRVVRLVPDVSGILNLIEDPSLLEFVDQHSKESSFNLNDCVDRLKMEAMQLLEMSENVFKKKQQGKNGRSEKADSCEEEDGLKSKSKKRMVAKHNSSLNESILSGRAVDYVGAMKERLSLPGNILYGNEEDNRSLGSIGELNSQMNELRNRLLVSESERAQLKVHLDEALKNHDNLTDILKIAKDRLEILESQKEDISEGYGISQLKSPSRQLTKTTYTDLQNTARSILSVTPDTVDGTVLLQQVEDFCNQLDRFVEEEKQNKNDLQEQNVQSNEANAQIEAAYKQKKSTSKLLEEQASEWQQERDDFTHEIESLSAQLRDREKKCTAYGHVVKEYEHMEQQIKEMTLSINDYKERLMKQELEQKAHIDKIFVLREVIADLEAQIEKKSFNEQTLADKVKTLEMYVTTQNHANESLHEEVEDLKQEFVVGYGEKIAQLEEQLRLVRPSDEHVQMVEQISAQLKQIESTLDQKTRQLEALHSDICSASCSTPTEDVSKGGPDSNVNSPAVTPRSPHVLPLDDVQRIMDKLVKHNRAEEAAVKRIRDLEMQIARVRTSYDELQNDRDLLQEKMTEQILRISSLQSRLDDQRHRAEEFHRQGTSDLNLKMYDLQTQLTNALEKLTAQDKQMAILKGHLEQSKQIIDRQEVDLARGVGSESSQIQRLEADLKSKDDENHRLREKMRSEMINKIALPDLMETMLSEKNEELDHVKEQLTKIKQKLQVFLDLNLDDRDIAELRKQHDMTDGKMSARSLSDIISLTDLEDESDIIRKMPESVVHNELSSKFFATHEISKQTFNEVSIEPSPIEPINFQHTMSSVAFPEMALPRPRQINFSLSDDSHSMENKTHDNVIEITPLQSMQNRSNGDAIDLHKQIASLQTRLDGLVHVESEVVSLKVKLDELQTEKSTISSELNRHRDAASGLKLDIAAKSQMISDVMSEKRALQTELNDNRLAMNRMNAAQEEAKALQELLEVKSKAILELERKLQAKSLEGETMRKELDELLGKVGTLSDAMSKKDELMTKHLKESQNWAHVESNYKKQISELQRNVLTKVTPTENEARLIEELEATKTDLYEKMIDFEKVQLDVQHLRDQLYDRGGGQHPDVMDDIAECVEKELNYSAHLDSSILKAIESDDVNSEEDYRNKKTIKQAAEMQFDVVQQKYEMERQKGSVLQKQLDAERQHSGSIHQQDAHIIETMRQRLEAAVEHETQMEQQLDDERAKVTRLSNQLLLHQRSLSRENSFLGKTPPESPRRTPRMSDMESELVGRLQSELKLLTAQNEREKERLMDAERVMEREKMRFEKELSDRRDHAERIKREMDRLLKEKETLSVDLENAQERLTVSSQEISNLEACISTLQESETRRASRRGKERNEFTQNAVDVQELRLKLAMVERERDVMQEKCTVLRGDIERGAQREAQLTEALLKEHSGEGMVPQQFLQKLSSIAENTKEYRHMAQTLQFLTEERHALQQRVDDMEVRNRAFNRDELEKRANHLFGKFLRVESFRKALVHQKRYLLIVLQTYQENEAKALAMINGKHKSKPKPKSFKSAVLVVIAIERMKYIVKRWQTGKRVGSDAIFSRQLPRRSASASTNNWVPTTDSSFAGQSPPSRDRPPFHPTRTLLSNGRPLQAPTLIAECSEHLPSSSRHWT